ncbi:MAG: autotransporter outer membrane beta-barrel domain-containing protein, partial [Candidatus Obscuribacterales bacterium]|nr:autotransporter outer membrane beta-barrel domain-containing protein [Steroidobacteraceae bacterium]
LRALRGGAEGFAVNGQQVNRERRDASAARTRGVIGAASADAAGDFSRWGGFLNVAHTWGDRDPTSLENAFDFNGTELAAGVDYRFNQHFVLGAMLGYTKQALDFDASQSATAGSIDADGLSAQVYASGEWDGPYLSASVGTQRLTQDTERVIRYQLSAPVTTVDITAKGSTDSSALTGFVAAGWSFQQRAWAYEPFLRYAYRNTDIDAFRESSINNLTGAAAGLDLRYNERSIDSSTAAVGFKVQYAWTPSFGVLVPYAQAEYRREFADEALQSQASFSVLDGAAGNPAASLINWSGDQPDTSYYLATLGASVVFKGGLQAFLQVQSLQGFDYSNVALATAGIRGEF